MLTHRQRHSAAMRSAFAPRQDDVTLEFLRLRRQQALSRGIDPEKAERAFNLAMGRKLHDRDEFKLL